MNLRKKICMLVTNDISRDIRVKREAESAVKAGYEVVIIGFSPCNEKIEKGQDSYNIILVPHSFSYFWLKVINWILYRFLSNKIAKGKKIYNELSLLSFIFCPYTSMTLEAIKQRADIYHANDLDTLGSAYKAAKEIQVKVLYDSHELWVEQNPEWSNWFKMLAFKFESRLIKRANIVVTVNNSIAKELERRYRIQAPIVVHNSPHFCNINTHRDKNLFKISIGIDPSMVVVLYHGKYEKGRGIEELIESGLYLRDNVVIVLRGFGSIEKELKEKVNKLNLIDKVKFLDPVPANELISAAAIADIGIVPYKATCINNMYATPNKFFEYLMAGLAIVASDLPEIKKIIEQSDCGFLFNPENPRDIANAINKLVENRDLLEEKKKNAFLVAKKVYNWESESKKLIDAYASLCK